MGIDRRRSRKNVARLKDPAWRVFEDFEDQLMGEGRSLSGRLGEYGEESSVGLTTGRG